MSDLAETGTGMMDDGPLQDDRAMQRVWDPLVRMFHWSLVAGIIVAYNTPFQNAAIHMWAGYAAIGLVVLRAVWGVIGTRHARFSNFVKRPKTVFAYMWHIARGTSVRHVGHNPAGGAMVVALILSISATGFTGWLMYTSAFHYGDDTIPRLHALAANVTLLLVIVHLAGVALVSLIQRENLVFSMITGKKRKPGPDDIA